MKYILLVLLCLNLSIKAQAGVSNEVEARDNQEQVVEETDKTVIDEDYIKILLGKVLLGDGEAIAEIKKLAEQGYAFAQSRMGFMYYVYYKGLSDPKDYKEAVKWFRLSAEQGYAEAQFNLGGMYYNGEGVSKDYVLAYKWLKLASSQGNEDAIKTLNIISKEMNPEQLEEAEVLVKEWKPKTWEELKKTLD